MKTTIGLVGYMAGGKGSISDLLISKGYRHFSYGGEIAKEVDKRMPGVVHTRDMRSDTAEILRCTFGNDILARRVVAEVDAERAAGRAEKVVIDGLRHPDEIAYLRQHYSSIHIFGVIIPDDEGDKIRYGRYLLRNRELDQPVTPETFRHYDNRDRGVGQPPYGNHVDDCLPLVDVLLKNGGSAEDLALQLNIVLLDRGIEGNPQGKERR